MATATNTLEGVPDNQVTYVRNMLAQAGFNSNDLDGPWALLIHPTLRLIARRHGQAAVDAFMDAALEAGVTAGLEPTAEV